MNSVIPNPEFDLVQAARELGTKAREAARQLATLSTRQKNAWLMAVADRLDRQHDTILQANHRDLARADEFGLTAAQKDRLTLTPARLHAAAAGLREVAALPDPVGRILDGEVRPNGLRVERVGVPIGVILFLYESRPNVTLDAAALAFKSGNAMILRGGKEAWHSNQALHALLAAELRALDLPAQAVQMVASPDRALVGELLRLSEWIDLVIPRGGESLIRRVCAEARMPVLKHYRGNCHVYVDAMADLEMASAIVINAKCQRPGVCNAAESLVVHSSVAEKFLPRVITALRAHGVEVRGCSAARAMVPDVAEASEDDFAAEFLDLVISLKVVDSLEAAIDHIGRYSSGHTEAIITNDLRAAEIFTQRIDSAAVMVNASTRFHDGQELGLGAEIGISTDKLHARGPCGLRELTTYKYIVHGQGHCRS